MPNFVSVSPATHASKKWRRFAGYRFASKDAAVPLLAAEIANAGRAMPLAFLKEGDKYVLSALLSVTLGQNLFVAPDGRWLGAYTPAAFRSYPFKFVTPAGADQAVLCVDGDLVVDTQEAVEGDSFYNGGEVTPVFQKAIDFLSGIERNRMATQFAVNSLALAGVIKPWPIQIKSEQGERTVDGLYCIDESAMNALDSEAFLKIRATGALSVAYTQMLSMGNLNVFENLAHLQAQLAPKAIAPLPDTLDRLFDRTDHLELKFD